MAKEAVLRKLCDCIINFDIDGVKEAAQETIKAGIPPLTAVLEGMAKGMNAVGEKYEKGEFFLSELMMAGETMKAGMEILKPYLKATKTKATGVVVIGTVKGDIHDIGKNIVIMLLTSAGFEVHDLGVDVPAERFVKETEKTGADIVALSALLSTTMPYMETVIDELKKAGLRDKVKVIIGGAPFVEEDMKRLGADALGKDAIIGLEICKEWMMS